jgi:hypothetical protein
MSPLPERCPTCGTGIPVGAVRCPGCGRVFGEDNRCPHCHAIAAVRSGGSGTYLCVACGKPRLRKPGTTLLGEEHSRSSLAPRDVSNEGRALRAAGAFTVGGGVLGAALATALLGTGLPGLAFAAIVGTASMLLALALFRRASVADREGRARSEESAAARVRAAAARLGGDVTAAQLAELLGVRAEEADRVLTSMADGTNVTVEVDTETGTVHYVFPELVAARPKVRVEPSVARDGEAESEPAAEPAVRRTRI